MITSGEFYETILNLPILVTSFSHFQIDTIAQKYVLIMQ